MFCKKCGRELPDGQAFCDGCGTPTGQGQPIAGQAAMPQEPQKKPMSKRTKLWIGIGAGAAVLIAVALILVFLVFGVDGAGGAQSLFSGNTTQTRFVNDAVSAVTGAFDDVGKDTLDKMMREPFDIEIEVDAEDGSGDIELAYDKKALGISAPSMTLLLDEDTLYIENWGVTEIDIDVDDIDKAMTLEDRIEAIVMSLAGDDQIDFAKIAEMLVNSIEEEHFDKDGDTATLTLDFDALIETLETFEEKVEDDEALDESFEDLMGGMKLSDGLSFVVPMMESQKEYMDFELEIEIGYEGGNPTSLEIKFDMADSDYDDFDAKWEYEKQGGSTKAGLEVQTADGRINGEYTMEKTGGGVEYEAELTDTYGDKYEIKGSEEWDGEQVKGELKASCNGETSGELEYEMLLHFGMPEEPVIEDRRFEIDTDDAYKVDLEDALEMMGGFGGFSLAPVAVAEEAPAYEEPTADDSAVAEEVVEEEPAEIAEEVEEEVVDDLYIAVLVPTTGYGFFDSFLDGVTETANAAGHIVEIMQSDYDSEKLAIQAETAVASGVDAIVLLPINPDALVPVVDNAAEAGVPVVVADMPVDSNGVLSLIRPDHTADGALAARVMVAQMEMEGKPLTGEVAVITGMEGALTMDQRVAGFTEELMDIAPDIAVVDVQSVDFDTEKAQIATEDILTKFPDVAGIFADMSTAAMGVMTAIEAVGWEDQITLVTFDPNETLIEGLEDSVVDAIVMVDAHEIGMQSMQAISDWYDGFDVPEETIVEPVVITIDNLAEMEAYLENYM